MGQVSGTVIIGDLTGGRNGGDSPFALLPDQCVSAVNVDWYGGAKLARRRNGMASVYMSGYPFGTVTGSNLATAWTNTSYDTFTSSGADITSAINTAGTTEYAQSNNLGLTAGYVYQIVATLTLNSGAAPTLSFGAGASLGALSAGANTFAFEATASQTVLRMTNAAASNYSCTFVVKRMTTVRPTALYRFVPTTDAAAELWMFLSTKVGGRLTGGTAVSTVTWKDAYSASTGVYITHCATFQARLYHAYDSAVNRLHVWDGSAHRRVGQARSTTAVTAGGTSAGNVTDTRRYKSTLIVKSGSTVVRRSELSVVSADVTYTSHKRSMTVGTLPSEAETHWELWGASILDNYGTYHYIGEADTSTTIEDNNITLTGYAPPEAGTNLVPPSCKYVLADDDRLIMMGTHEASAATDDQVTPSPRRVWWTPAPGSADISDKPASQQERVVITATLQSYLDVSADITGGGGPIDGRFFVFSRTRTWEFLPTGIVTAPYRRQILSKTIGCIDHRSIVEAEDENGNPAVYFWSTRGPYRVTVSRGLEYMGYDIEDLIETWNKDATYRAVGVYHAQKHQIWWWIPEAGQDFPTLRLTFDTRLGTSGTIGGGQPAVRKGWSTANGPMGAVIASTLFASSLSASLTNELKPWIAQYTSDSGLMIGDSGATDGTVAAFGAGASFTASIQTGALNPWGRRKRGRFSEPYVLAKALAATTIKGTVTRDLGAETVSDTVSIAPAASETYVSPEWSGIDLSGEEFGQFTLSDDATPSDTSWLVQEVALPWVGEEDV